MANDNTLSMDSIYRTVMDGVSAVSTVPGMTKDIRVDAVTGTAQADALLAPRSQGVISHAGQSYMVASGETVPEEQARLGLLKSSQALADTLRKMDERYLPYADAVMERMATFAVAAVLKRDPQATRAEQIEAVSAAQMGLAQEVASGRFANSLRSSVESVAPVHVAAPER